MSEIMEPYLELSNNPVRFEAVNQVTNVFFDDSNKQDSNTNQNVLINCEEVTGNYYKSDSIYFTAEDRTEAASLIGMEQNKFLTSTESDKSNVTMRNEVKKTSFRYFDDKNAGIHCINKKQNNFDRYIEEIVKKKRRKTQYIDEHYFSNTPIDLCNNNIHHKVTKKNNCDISLKKKIVSDESEITKQNKTDTVTNRNINVFKETSRSSVDLNNNCLEKSKKINIVSNIQLCPPIFDLNSVNCLRELKFSNKSICDDVLPFNCVSKVENDAIEVKRNNFDSKLSNIEPNLEVFEVEDSDEEIVFIADVTPPKIQSRPLNRSNHTAPLPKGWLSKSNKTYFTCAICKSKFRDATAFRSHVFLHESEKYKCNVCSKKYRREYHLRQHVRKSHNY